MSQTYVEKKSQLEEAEKAAQETAFLPKDTWESPEEISSKDLAFGQPVIVTMRWILVVSGLLLILWNPDSLPIMRVQILIIFLLALANFYLHSQLLMKRPVKDEVVFASSAVDLILVSVLILIGSGFESRLLVYYFPAIVSFSVVFPTILTATYVGTTMGAYGLISIATGGDFITIMARLIMIAAIGYCGNLYLRSEKSRREDARESRERLLDQIQERQATTV